MQIQFFDFRIPIVIPGIVATALAAITCYFPNKLAWNDDHFTAMSLACR